MRTRGLLAVLLLAAAVRAPFWAFAARASVDGDSAIVGLMARHPGRGLTLWGQPYGSPLDGWLAAPFVAAMGARPIAVRVPSALLALALVAAAGVIGERLRAGAGAAAALLLACPPAYALLLSSLPPPLYASTLALLAAVIALAADPDALMVPPRVPRGRLALIGTLGGLATWTHLMSLATLGAVAGVLVGRAWRARAGARLLWAAVPFALACAPWWLEALRHPAAVSVLGLARDGATPLAHARAVIPRLHEPLAALLGTWSPVTADESERIVAAPRGIGLAIVLAWLALVAAGLRASRARPLAWMLAGAAALTVLAFPWPVRSDPHTIRFLTPALLPLAALAGAGAARLAGPLPPWLVVLPLCAAQLTTGARLLEAWRRAGPEAIVPSCASVLDLLAGRGITRAYASYHTAYCLTYTSAESLIASPPWNERFYGHPLPYLDDVRADPRAAWVLVPGVDFDLPAPRTFESKLAGIGGTATRLEAGPARVYVDFVPPFGAAVETGAIAGPAGDGDLRTRVVEPAAGPTTFALVRPAAAAGVTLLAGPTDPGLPAAMDVEVSSDGVSFERIGRRRRGRETVDLDWVNGHPQFLVDSLAFSVPLDGRTIVAVRVTPTEAQPWAIAEVLVHPADLARAPWTSSGDGSRLYRELLALRAR